MISAQRLAKMPARFRQYLKGPDGGLEVHFEALKQLPETELNSP